MDLVTETFISNSEAETIKIGKDFAKRLKHGDIVAFYAELGAGKTQFIKGLCNALKVGEVITSPTFTIINQYFGEVDFEETPIYHIDLYRIKSVQELFDIGFKECLFDEISIKLIEWAERSFDTLPDEKYSIHIETDENDENLRKIKISFPISEEYFNG